MDGEYNAVVDTQVKDWMELSRNAGLSIFERQPEETSEEWRIWVTYRQYYPMRMPKWSELAKELNVTVATVLRASQKWSFGVRLQAWARFTDDTMLEDRAQAIKQMNINQQDMARRIQAKISEGIDLIDPTTLKPNELTNLMKFAVELDRQITTALPEQVKGTVEEAGTARQAQTRPEDLASVISILQQTGLLDGKSIGVEQQKTTRILAKEEPEHGN